jgi:hypothetical protein
MGDGSDHQQPITTQPKAKVASTTTLSNQTTEHLLAQMA